MAVGAMGVDPKRAAAIERKRIRDANRGKGAMSKDPTLSQSTESAMQSAIGRIGGIQNFAPGDYGAQREAANAAVMDSFERRMNPQFQREQQQFDQYMAETGNPIGSENYNTQLQLLRQSQGDQRLNAQNQAFLTGQSEQQQGFNQNYTGWNANAQLPMQQYSMLAPWMMQQNQQQFLGGQNALDRKNQINLANIGARASRGGGGDQLTYDQRLGLIDAEAYNNFIAQGNNMFGGYQKPNLGNSFAGGVASGVGAGLGGALRS